MNECYYADDPRAIKELEKVHQRENQKTARWKRILSLRIKGKSLSYIANKVGLSKEMVRRLLLEKEF